MLRVSHLLTKSSSGRQEELLRKADALNHQMKSRSILHNSLCSPRKSGVMTSESAREQNKETGKLTNLKNVFVHASYYIPQTGITKNVHSVPNFIRKK